MVGITVDELQQSERKLVVNALDFSREYISDESRPFSLNLNQKMSMFITDFPFEKIELTDSCVNVIVKCTGIVAKKLISSIDCLEYRLLIGDNDRSFEIVVEKEIVDYFDQFNCIGLT